MSLLDQTEGTQVTNEQGVNFMTDQTIPLAEIPDEKKRANVAR